VTDGAIRRSHHSGCAFALGLKLQKHSIAAGQPH
jgi:hypothetical protein